MILLRPKEIESAKVIATNSLFTIVETKAQICFEKGEIFEFNFDEISNIRIVKKVESDFLLISLLVSVIMVTLFCSFIETNRLYKIPSLVISFVLFILLFYAKKKTYKLSIYKKNLDKYSYPIENEMVEEVKIFVQTIREIKRKNK
jgi:hypothetical protein